MNTALIKDILREIRKSLGRFLSILLIVALGVAFFAGVRASVPDMKYTADAYFDEYNMQDIQLIGTFLKKRCDMITISWHLLRTESEIRPG